MAEHRHHHPREGVQQREDRHTLGAALATHHVVVPVGHHDHVARVGPVAHTIVDGNPARPGSDDVKQGQPIGARDQRVSQGKRARFELERLGELGPKKQRPFQTQVLKRRGQHVVHRDNLGGTANPAGVLVMGFPSLSPHDRSRP
jgi:hypothetical protein